MQIIEGDALTRLRALPGELVDCCITSPPYWGLRDYGTAQWEGGEAECDHRQEAPRFNGLKQTQAQVSGHASKAESHNRRQCPKCGAVRIDAQIGLEHTPAEYVARLVEVFREVRRVLRADGTLFLNLGDSYNTLNNRRSASAYVDGGKCKLALAEQNRKGAQRFDATLKPKDLCGIPWRVAFALQADGWYLRSDIIWHKPNPMPESVTDRPTKSHDYVFMLAKQERYFYDADAIKETSLTAGETRISLATSGSYISAVENGRKPSGNGVPGKVIVRGEYRNRRSVWTLATLPTPDAHFATFPIELPETCLLAGSRPGGIVLDPFSGAGTTGLAAIKHGRDYIGIELNPKYIEISRTRLARHMPLLAAAAI